MIAAALCITIGALTTALPVQGFTLRWQHTVEKLLWEEEYLVAGDWLVLTGARVRGSGAGMEPPAGAVLVGDAWVYRPADRWRRSLLLARSEFGADYELCSDGRCEPLGAVAPGPLARTTLAPCAGATRR
jgi:hypothetical protein